MSGSLSRTGRTGPTLPPPNSNPAGRLLEIPVLDPIIISNVLDDSGGKGYFSRRESGLM